MRKVEDKLIERKPELHDMLHDGLVLTEKSRKRAQRRQNRKPRRSSSLSRLDESHFMNERPHSGLGSLAPQYENNSALFHAIQKHNSKDHACASPASSLFYDSHNRLSRSVSPFRMGISLNTNLKKQNQRTPRLNNSGSNGPSRSRSASGSASRRHDRTYDVLATDNGTISDLYFLILVLDISKNCWKYF